MIQVQHINWPEAHELSNIFHRFLLRRSICFRYSRGICHVVKQMAEISLFSTASDFFMTTCVSILHASSGNTKRPRSLDWPSGWPLVKYDQVRFMPNSHAVEVNNPNFEECRSKGHWLDKE